MCTDTLLSRNKEWDRSNSCHREWSKKKKKKSVMLLLESGEIVGAQRVIKMSSNSWKAITKEKDWIFSVLY